MRVIMFLSVLTFGLLSFADKEPDSDLAARFACAKEVFNSSIQKTKYSDVKATHFRLFRHSMNVLGGEFFATDYRYVEYEATNGKDTFYGDFQIMYRPSTPYVQTKILHNGALVPPKGDYQEVCQLISLWGDAFTIYNVLDQKVDKIESSATTRHYTRPPK